MRFRTSAAVGSSSSLPPRCFLLGLLWLLSFAVTMATGWTWTKADHAPGGGTSSNTKQPPQVSGHIAVSSPKVPGAVYLFGGLTGPAGSPVTDTLYEYDAGGGWREIAGKKGALAKTPRQRMYSASGILKDGNDGAALYLFGGWDPGAPGSGGEFLKDVWKLNLVTKEWTDMNMELHFPVSRHAACTVGNTMIVVHTYQGILVFDNNDGKITARETTGDGPDGLSMCAQVALGDTGVLIFGGSTKTQQLSDSAYYLDTTTWKWTRLVNVGDAPSARASPCAAPVADNENQAVLFGGASIGSTGYEGGRGLMPLSDTWLVTVDKVAGTAEWKQVAMSDVGPESRLAATLTCIYGEGGNRMLLQGGYDSTAKKTFSEPWVLRSDK